MRPAFMQGVDAGFDHVRRSIEVRFANLQVDDAFALTLQGPSLVQDLECSFGTQARHAAGELQFVLRGLFHSRKTPHATNGTLYARDKPAKGARMRLA